MTKFLNKFLPITICFVFFSCKVNYGQSASNNGTNKSPYLALEQEEYVNWHHKDYSSDSLPGISLEKAYDEVLKNKKGKEVIIAVIDTDVNISHPDLHNQIWVNKKEKVNGKDDDRNGYIDDVNGWNFISDSIGNTELFVNYEYTRILKKYDTVFSNIDSSNVAIEDRGIYQEYLRAKQVYSERMQYALKEKNYIDYYLNSSQAADKALSQLFPDKKYSKSKIDSLLKLKTTSPLLVPHLNYILTEIKYNITDEWLSNYRLKTYERLDKLLNKKFNDRQNIGDNVEDLNDINYGSPIIDKQAEFLEHGTLVAGAIASTRDNTGAEGISNNIKLMILTVSSLGDENDKDLALAIRYAVDNGAKVINISSGKKFSIHKDWIMNEMKNAEKEGVLIITSAGNSNVDLDRADSYSYPNDTDELGHEKVGNFIKVSSSSYKMDNKFKENETAYGKKNVDLFAPGEKIYTTSALKEKPYQFSSGTSMASAVTSGIAGLLFSYYPKLTAKQVKQILMASGTSYDVEVEIILEDKSKKMIPFSELSKSGKVINAYNALLMAEKLSKK